ncbi:FecCD family ABC transporter permease [Helicovermis profundi]|uniref:Iron ABC transporter permease n=1 Tax=Helicovermis profundi TaxID=3065157 RepID=A0AAU9EQW5_9FIRM|nr:iron ABC transporter permease [Clostridia bacterium S502]
MKNNRNIINVKNSRITYERKLIFKFSLLLFVVLIISMFIGRYKIGFYDLVEVLGNFQNYLFHKELISTNDMIIYNIRLPRIILAILVGAGLSVSGLVFQNIFKNPIASPDILGVTSGASFGAALGIILPMEFPLKIELLSFIFGLVAVSITYIIKKMSKNTSLLYLILSGIIVSAFFTSLLSFIKYIADPYNELPSIVFWTMGGLFNATWGNVLSTSIIVIPSIIIINALKFKIKILSLKDDEAKSLGVNVYKLRKFILIIVSLVVSYVVSVAGTIGWIALIVPHIVKIISKKNRDIYLSTAIFGGTILLVFDDLARSISPSEIPVGILTALIGAPILAYLLLSKKAI